MTCLARSLECGQFEQRVRHRVNEWRTKQNISVFRGKRIFPLLLKCPTVINRVANTRGFSPNQTISLQSFICHVKSRSARAK